MKILLVGFVLALAVEGLRLSKKVEEVSLPGANLPEGILSTFFADTIMSI